MSVTIQLSISLPDIDQALELLEKLVASVSCASESYDVKDLSARLEVFDV